ncbi:hypothetical protein HanRHA438_Chr14g0631931 [Helianthus annuus]|uniref:Uncharacterized protein n=1 Tax=Helianthus annuus TaxID=4232 RepID=A0A9K3E589_HELAN|nr:hypothetical protein HanXRQr2_Chr14g0622021 [Helianthus annuus]KAJ0484179.1 hypothetical protein HanHA89_Chr14g0541231 [Helianthus annuus]KAJ0658482.1 hypothetical protein HanOQP8_Chr14g0508721 [Helianthus annuus]KAJ0851882.1 hypothetical protein HanRHA438_Chr14g0631931 [Helianthus annuus]
MYAARSKITDLEAQIATLKGKDEEVQADKERTEAKLNAHKDKELAAKDVIDLDAEKVKADTAKEAKKKAEEARDISTSALNVAQNNYAEAQTIVDTLVSESEWMRNRGIAKVSSPLPWVLFIVVFCSYEFPLFAYIANSILNATEMDEAAATLIDASRAVGHHGGYLQCAQHVEEAFGQQFDTHHCSVTDQADSMLSQAEEVHDHLSLPVMELVTEAMKHDDWCARLKSIIDPPETVELMDEEEAADGDGDDDGDGDGYE